MRTVTRAEILPLAEYEAVRPHFRGRIIEEKKRRRVNVGEFASCVFESHDTVLLQIQEMLRTERITREAAILHELETYNQLVPGPNELSATLMFEIVDPKERAAFLSRAAGVHKRVFLEVGGVRHAATWSGTVDDPHRASTVNYLKIPLPEGASAALSAAAKAGAPEVALVVDHPAYRARAVLPREVLASLAEDLAEPS
jgi:hypothetical protein